MFKVTWYSMGGLEQKEQTFQSLLEAVRKIKELIAFGATRVKMNGKTRFEYNGQTYWTER